MTRDSDNEHYKRAWAKLTSAHFNQARLLFDGPQRTTLYTACRVAAEQFKKDADALRGNPAMMSNPNLVRLAEQFERQEGETLALMELFE